MASGGLVQSNKLPVGRMDTAAAALSDRKWQSLLGLVATGVRVSDACKKLTVSKSQLEGILRADKAAKAAWEDAKLAAMRRVWDIDTVEDVLTKVAMNEAGGYLKSIIEDMGLDPASFYRLLLKDDEIRQMYEQAREVQAEIQADEMRQIADDGRNDSYVDDRGRARVDHDVVQRSKLRIDTLKWTMSKLHYKRFGDKIQQDVNANVVVDHAERLEKARRRMETMRDG